ncbi:MAG: class I SAM-dependent methyltransferase [Promethearchaeota archaeon]
MTKKTSGKPKSNLDFRMMCFFKGLSYKFNKPRVPLEELGISNGQSVLDFGCGPGYHAVAAAKMVGPKGRVYAVDRHPLSGRKTLKLAGKAGVGNVVPITASRDTGLDVGSVDVVLLYDVIHQLGDPGPVLEELHRVLKPGGRLSVQVHHVDPVKVVAEVEATGLFRLERVLPSSHVFARA